jgi:hypothetical protein
VVSSTNLNRQRDATMLSRAGKPRPPLSIGLLRAADYRTIALSILCGQSRPRSPPLSFS